MKSSGIWWCFNW